MMTIEGNPDVPRELAQPAANVFEDIRPGQPLVRSASNRRMMTLLKGFEHVGMTCSDLDRTIAFYCDLLGLKQVLRKATPGGEVAFLDAGGGMLEIVQPTGAVRGPAREVPRDEAGIRHITLTVDDIDATHRQLVAAGVIFTEAPREAYNKEMLKKVAFCLDPDGISVELAER